MVKKIFILIHSSFSKLHSQTYSTYTNSIRQIQDIFEGLVQDCSNSSALAMELL